MEHRHAYLGDDCYGEGDQCHGAGGTRSDKTGEDDALNGECDEEQLGVAACSAKRNTGRLLIPPF